MWASHPCVIARVVSPIPRLEFLYSKVLHFPLPSSGSLLLCTILALVYRPPLLGVAASPESLTDNSCKPTEEGRVMWLLSLFPLILRALLEAVKADTFYASYIEEEAAEIFGQSLCSPEKMLLSWVWFLLFFAKQGLCGSDGFTTGRISFVLGEYKSWSKCSLCIPKPWSFSILHFFSSVAKP